MMWLPLVAGPSAEPTVGAWMVFWNPASVTRWIEHSDSVQEILPEWYQLGEDGTVSYSKTSSAKLRQAVLQARRPGTRILGMINNFGSNGFDGARVSRIVASEDSRRRHAKALADLVRKDRLDGIDIDYESFPSADRDRFSLLVRELKRELSGRHLSVTVHPKETPDGNWDGPKAQEWKAIGEVADSVRIMTYDFSWSGGEAGPIAPNDWVERVMKFAISQIPREKLRLGVAAYGYDWSTSPAKSLTFGDFGNEPYEIDPKSGERRRGKIRFAAVESMRAKVELAKRLGIPGICIWYLGSEDPDFWRPSR